MTALSDHTTVECSVCRRPIRLADTDRHVAVRCIGCATAAVKEPRRLTPPAQEFNGAMLRLLERLR